MKAMNEDKKCHFFVYSVFPVVEKCDFRGGGGLRCLADCGFYVINRLFIAILLPLASLC